MSEPNRQHIRDLARRVRDLLVAAEQYRQALATALGTGIHEATALERLFHEEPLTPTAIAERLGVTTASVTGLLDRLAAAGYLERSPNPRDRRSVLVRLTGEGRRLLDAAFTLFTADVAAALPATPGEDLTELTELVRRTAERLSERVAQPQMFAACLEQATQGSGPPPHGDCGACDTGAQPGRTRVPD